MLKETNNTIKYFIITFVLNIFATLLSTMIKHIGFTEVNIVVIYILSVLITSRYTKGYVYGIAASVFSMLSFNFFFTEPLYTLNVEDKTYLFTFVVMLLAAILTSTLTSKLIRSKELADIRENQAQILYNITSSLSKIGGVANVVGVSAQCLSSILESDVTFILITSKNNKIQKFTAQKSRIGLIIEDSNNCEIKNMRKKFEEITILCSKKISCVAFIPKQIKTRSKERILLIDSVIVQIGIAIEREVLTEGKEAAKTETENEKFKSNMLRAISHDLRTPLTAIIGTSEMIMQKLEDEEIIKLTQNIYEDAEWLIRLVENILSLTKIQEGKLKISAKQEAVEEIIAEAVRHSLKYYPNYKISIMVPEDVIFIKMDGKLIKQVLINLIENAIKHSPPANKIEVTVYEEDSRVWFEVSDSGTGIREGDIFAIFDMFFVSTTAHTDATRGTGLGLSICKAIVNFHGAEIYAENNKTGGAKFKFYLKK